MYPYWKGSPGIIEAYSGVLKIPWRRTTFENVT
jgi:hypothetical protein